VCLVLFLRFPGIFAVFGVGIIPFLGGFVLFAGLWYVCGMFYEICGFVGNLCVLVF